MRIFYLLTKCRPAIENYQGLEKMSLLTTCWFIIERIIIPDGFNKWFCLNFFIHSLVLCACQIFLWIKFIIHWFIFTRLAPLRLIVFLCSYVSRIINNYMSLLFSFIPRLTRSTESRVVVELEVNLFDEMHINNFKQRNQIVSLYFCSKPAAATRVTLKGDLNEALSSICRSNSPNNATKKLKETEETGKSEEVTSVEIETSYGMEGSEHEQEGEDSVVENKYLLSVRSSNSFNTNREEMGGQVMGEDSSGFYKKYTERMNWYDLLNHDRTYGISAILNKPLESPGSFESNSAVNCSVPHNKMSERRLMRSLESDFELVYVAQSCLSWEALHYQYRKVEALICSPSQDAVFVKNVAADFQKFQILLERFMENERPEGKRAWNYVRGRFSLRSLLQVPDVPGFLEKTKAQAMKGEVISVEHVLKAIEKCIHVFWVFVKSDNKINTWWKFCTFSWKYPPVEDPTDLHIFTNLTKRLRKNEIWMKDVQKKKRCWLNKGVNSHGEESQKKEILLTMIDMKLVSRVIQMPMLSTKQLKWCQEKLHSIEFRKGNVTRICNTVHLFPP